MRILLALALAASLSACVGERPRSAGEVVANASLTLDKVEATYSTAKLIAALVEPFLPVARVAQIRRIEARIDAALEAARKAVTLAEQIKHLTEARDAVGELSAVTVGPSD